MCDQREPYLRIRASDEIGATYERGEQSIPETDPAKRDDKRLVCAELFGMSSLYRYSLRENLQAETVIDFASSERYC